MRVEQFEDGTLRIDDAEVIYSYRNFAGAARSQFDREGDRHFSIKIDDPKLAEDLIKAGWNVKIKDPREEGDPPFMFMKVKVRYRKNNGEKVKYPPTVYVNADGKITKYDESMIGVLDDMDIIKADIDINAYDWDFANRSGRTACLRSMMVYQDTSRYHRSRFDEEYDKFDKERKEEFYTKEEVQF